MTTYLSYQDISDLTGVPISTLRVWRTRGKLPEPDYHKARVILWTPKTIDTWLKERENGTAGPTGSDDD